MEIRMYGKTGCGICASAKAKLDAKKLPYTYYDLEKHPENWRDLGYVDTMAEYQLTDKLPIFSIDGEFMLYPKAMKTIKQRGKKQ